MKDSLLKTKQVNSYDKKQYRRSHKIRTARRVDFHITSEAVL